MTNKKKKLEGRGGPGRNQGRKAKYISKTEPIRVPTVAIPEIKRLLKKYLSIHN